MWTLWGITLMYEHLIKHQLNLLCCELDHFIIFMLSGYWDRPCMSFIHLCVCNNIFCMTCNFRIQLIQYKVIHRVPIPTHKMYCTSFINNTCPHCPKLTDWALMISGSVHKFSPLVRGHEQANQHPLPQNPSLLVISLLTTGLVCGLNIPI